MGRELHYRPGSFYRVDDRTGFAQRAERTRKEWNGLIVDEGVFEPRQPQDLVKGVRDDQSVPEARPLAPNTFVGPTFTKLAAAAGPGVAVLTLESTAGFFQGCSVSVMQDNGTNLNTKVGIPPTATTITLVRALAASASAGNLVTNNTPRVPAGQEP